MVIIREVFCKSIIGRCGIAGIDYSINPYTGCQHACSYCYARFMVKLHGRGERWGEFVDVKVNAPQVLSRQLPRVRQGLTWISSVTDPYQPVEEGYLLTRQVLQRLLPYQFPVTVLTKSKLVVRDIDLFRQFKACEVGMTVITLDETVRERFEPGSSTISERLNALKTLHEAGVKTYAFVGPLLPFVSEETVDELAGQLEGIGVGRVLVDKLNVKGGNWETIEETLSRYYPDLLSGFRNVLFSRSGYYSELKKRVGDVFEKRGLEFSFCY